MIFQFIFLNHFQAKIFIKNWENFFIFLSIFFEKICLKMIQENKSKYPVKNIFLFITALIFMFISKLRFPKKVSIVKNKSMETFFGKRSLLINIKIKSVMNKNIFFSWYFDLFSLHQCCSLRGQAFMFDFYLEERLGEIPHFIGCAHMLPSNLRESVGLASLPITSPKHLPIGHLNGESNTF